MCDFEISKCDQAQCTLKGDLNIYSAQADAKYLLALISAKPEVTLDLSQVESIDGAGIQLLMALKKQSLIDNCQLSIINHSDAVLEIMNMASVFNYFGDPVLHVGGAVNGGAK